jgi:putative ABC transport system ATP-binding protein
LLLTNLSKAERRDRIEMTLGMVGLTERMDHYPNELSGGQQQRVAIARAIVTDPTILVCDEPTGDLDKQSATDVLNMLKELNDRLGKTIIMVTHDAHAAEAAKRMVHLEKGELLDG